MFGEESGTIPPEGLVSTGESNWCLICGSNSKNKRNNNTSTVYPSGNKKCLPKTVKVLQQKQIKLGKTNKLSNPSHDRGWIQCTLCKKRSCIKCITAICREMQKNRDHKTDDWYKNVENMIYNAIQVKDFIGHCCEIKHKIGSIPIDKTPSELRYDGYIHFPEIALLMSPPLVEFVDIHGFGKEDNNERPGMIHAVIDKSTAKKCFVHNIIPDGKRNNLQSRIQTRLELRDIFGDLRSISCNVDIYTFCSPESFKHLQHNAVGVEDIRHSKVVNNQPNKNEIQIVVAKAYSYARSAHLVNIRLRSGLARKLWDGKKSKELFMYIKTLLPREGMEASRRSGSNGLTTFNSYNILSLLKTNNAFPRKGKGVKLVRGKTEWRCYYLATGRQKIAHMGCERKIACWKYAQPHIGGQFKTSTNIYDMFPDVFGALTRSKYNAAIVVNELSKVLNLNIQKDAVNAALSELKIVHSKFPNRRELLKNLFLYNKCTLVAHPVSYHYDVFHKGQSSLENKLCFNLGSKDDGNDIGRGGAGYGNFVFAILDWTTCSNNKRKYEECAEIVNTFTNSDGKLIVSIKTTT